MKTTIKLKDPITIDGTQISELTMRAPKVKDQLAVEKISGDGTREITLMANLCEVTPADIEELSMCDYKEVQKAYQGFLSSTPQPSDRPA